MQHRPKLLRIKAVLLFPGRTDEQRLGGLGIFSGLCFLKPDPGVFPLGSNQPQSLELLLPGSQGIGHEYGDLSACGG